MRKRNDVEHLHANVFRKLVVLHMLQALVFSITGIVDCAVVGQVLGESGLAGMKLAMPIFAIQYFLIGSVLSSGLSVQMTRLLGQGRRDSANQCLLWVLALVAGISGLLFLAALLFPNASTRLFAGNADAAVFGFTKGYLLPIMWGSLPIILQGILSTVCALEGAGRRMTVSVIMVLVVDIVGDGLAVILKAGMVGIAVASVAAYISACLVLAGQFFSKQTIFRKERLRYEKGLISGTIRAGLPMAVKGVCEFFCPVAINRLMLQYGTVTGLAALSIQDAARYLPLAFCEGLAAATLLVTGMYAAEDDAEALHQERKTILIYGLGIGALWALILAASAPLSIRIFTNDTALRALGLSAFLWYLAGVPFISLNYAIRAYFQGKGGERKASLYTLINQLVLPVFTAWIFGRIWGIFGIFAAFAVHEAVLLLLFALFRLTAEDRTMERLAIIGEIRGSATTVDEVMAASESVIRLCAAHGIDHRQAYHIGLCLEELATNALKHGFKYMRSGDLEYRFVIAPQALILRVRDNGRPFDLIERYKLLNPEDPASLLGLRVIFAAAEEVSASHTFGLNNVCIRISREPEHAGAKN